MFVTDYRHTLAYRTKLMSRDRNTEAKWFDHHKVTPLHDLLDHTTLPL